MTDIKAKITSLIKQISEDREVIMTNLDPELKCRLVSFFDWVSLLIHGIKKQSEDEINHEFFCIESRVSSTLIARIKTNTMEIIRLRESLSTQ